MGAMASQITSLTICLLSRLFGRRSKKTPNLCVTGLCASDSPMTGEFPTQRSSNAENVSIWWRHHILLLFLLMTCWVLDICEFGRWVIFHICKTRKRSSSLYITHIFWTKIKNHTNNTMKNTDTQIARFIWGQHGEHLGLVRPRWAPNWPHKPCYQSISDLTVYPDSYIMERDIQVISMITPSTHFVFSRWRTKLQINSSIVLKH